MQFKTYNILAVMLLLLSMAGCSKEPQSTPEKGGNGSVNFALTLLGEVTEQPLSRASVTEPKPIKRLWHAILDAQGNAMQVKTQYLKPDFSNLFIEGLSTGDYSIVFLATTGDVAADEIDKIDKIAQQWLTNSSDNAPLDEDYLYNRIDFRVDQSLPTQTIAVELQRVTGRVEIDLKADNPQSLRLITHIDISYDDASVIYKQMAADKTYTGQMVIKGFDITQNRGFYSLPSTGKLSGVITITALTSDEQQVVSKHRFSDAQIVQGLISTIAISYTHPEDNLGFFTVSKQDYTPQNSMQMFRDDEPRAVFYNNAIRSFYVDEPLQVTINEQKELQIKFYSAIAIKDTKIFVRFKKYSNEFYELAHYDEILPYHQSKLPIPVVSKARIFRSQDGRNVLIPAQPNLVATDCEFKIVSQDPYMKKIATITAHWRITFNPYSADAPSSNWRHLTPALCREGVVLTTNMAFMFVSDEFNAEMERKKADGTYFYSLLDGNNIPIEHDVIRAKIKNQSALNMGAVGGVQGLGSVGGTAYGLTPGRYYDHYWNHGTAADYHKTTAYHEFGHCIGYGHSGTMTYGNQWTVLCSRVMYDMGKANKLLVNSRWVLNTANDTTIPPLPSQGLRNNYLE